MLKKILIAAVLLILVGLGAFYLVANRELSQNVDRLFAQILASGAYQDLSYDSVTIGLDGTVRLEQLTVVEQEGLAYTFQTVDISDYDYQHDIPRHARLKVSGLSFPKGLPVLEENEPHVLTDYLQSLMRNEVLPLVIDYRFAYEPEQEYLISNTASFDLQDAGVLSINAMVKQIPLEEFFAYSNEQFPELAHMQLLNTLSRAEIPEAGLSFQDAGVLNAALEKQAVNAGMSREDFQQRLISQIQGLPLFFPASLQGLMTSTSAKLSSFLEGGKTFSIAIEPMYDGNIQRLQPEILSAFYTGDYNRIAALLNLKLETR
ncbi:MAG: hypothetical protein RQ899_13850 [Pseudomonadales bacterium]|nr:hypothetical protein [Pseudomonadales bacterium]